MRLLRTDIKIIPNEQGDNCHVQDEASGEIYEFGAVEYFLIDLFKQAYDIQKVVDACNSHFDLHYTHEDIEEFLGLLGQWGLLQDSGAKPPPDVAEEESTEQDALDVQRPNRWHLFKPDKVLVGLYRTLYPLRIFGWLIPLVFTIGVITVIKNSSAFLTDMSKAMAEFGLLGRLLFAAISINLITQVARGLVARHFALATPSFGFLLLFGLIPRFNLQIIANSATERTARLWLSVTSTLVRLLLFGLAVIAWATSRPSGTFLSSIAAELAVICLISLAFVANPLWRGDGSNFLSALINVPNLYKRSRSTLWGFFVPQPSVISRHARHRILLGLFGLASTLFFIALIGFIGLKVFNYLEQQYQGSGVSLFLFLAAYISFNLRRQAQAAKQRKDLRRSPQLAAAPKNEKSASYARRSSKTKTSGWLNYLLFIAFLLTLALPYRFETGGVAEILPTERITLTAQTDGTLDEVHFQGGEWLIAGTLVARLDHHRQQKDLSVTEASIAAKHQEIKILRTTPSAEEIKLAEIQLETARLQMKHSLDELERNRKLVAQGSVSTQDFDEARVRAELDTQLLHQSEANLQVVKTKVNPSQISLLEAELARLQDEQRFYQIQLERTKLLTPISGYLVTKDLAFQRNKYFEAGQTIAEVENLRQVMIRIALAEVDIGEISIGSTLRLKLWAYPERVFTGVVEKIEQAVEELEYGRVAYVTSRINNEENLLKSGMTGHAKIMGNDTRVLWAFTRALIRFVRIEIWSWLP
jgi:putative peptide zinc metalloprotease protein